MNTIKFLTALFILAITVSSCSKEEEFIQPCEKDNFGSLVISNYTESDFNLHINGSSYGIIEKNITKTVTTETGNIKVEMRGQFIVSNVYHTYTDFLQSCDNMDVTFY